MPLALRRAAERKAMSAPVVFLDEVDSTNTYVKTHFDELPDGALVSASCQSAGRGRLNRRWQSPRGVNFYGTAALKNCPDPFRATIALSLATLDALRELVPELPAYIKWPNDIYVGHAKLAGMLCESVTGPGNAIRGIAAGIGVNLNMCRADLAAIDQAATGVWVETGIEINPSFFTKKLAFYLERRYINYSKSPNELFAEWKRNNRLIGKTLRVEGIRGAKQGIFEDVAETGEMLLRTSEGLEKVNSGDVMIDKQCLT